MTTMASTTSTVKSCQLFKWRQHFVFLEKKLIVRLPTRHCYHYFAKRKQPFEKNPA